MKHNFFSVTVMVAMIATISTVAAVETISEVEALKGQGVYNGQYGSATKGIVCGDMLCSEVAKEQATKSSDESQTKTESSLSTSQPSLSASIQAGEISVDSIVGATIKDTEIDKQSGIVTVSINAHDDGMVMLNLDSAINDVFMVIVDGEEWDDVYLDDKNNIEIHLYAGTEKIEILGNVLGR